jgi:predicted metalloenzyme YecM
MHAHTTVLVVTIIKGQQQKLRFEASMKNKYTNILLGNQLNHMWFKELKLQKPVHVDHQFLEVLEYFGARLIEIQRLVTKIYHSE